MRLSHFDFAVSLPTRLAPRPSMAAAAIVLAVLAGCAPKQDGPGPGDKPAVETSKDAPRKLAYEHTVSFDAAPDQVVASHAAGLAACRNAGAASCTLLASRIDSEPAAEATLKFRAEPKVIPLLVAAMGSRADLAHRSIRAEDLSGPIADTARRLAMLEDYRGQLQALRARAGNDIESLMKVNRELAEVQASVEAADGQRALLAQRVETEILNVSIHSERQRPFWSPIARALRNFGGQLAEGIAYAITALAYLLPWLFMIALALWALRRWWRGSWRRSPARQVNDVAPMSEDR